MAKRLVFVLCLVVGGVATASAQGVGVEPDPGSCVVGVDPGCVLALANSAAQERRVQLEARDWGGRDVVSGAVLGALTGAAVGAAISTFTGGVHADGLAHGAIFGAMAGGLSFVRLGGDRADVAIGPAGVAARW